MVALKIVLMAHNAWMMGDAIVRTLYRLFVSRQNLLEWRTASQAHKAGDNDVGSYYGMFFAEPGDPCIGSAEQFAKVF